MSAYANVVGGKLKLKGKALDVKAGGIKKKKKEKKQYEHNLAMAGTEPPSTGTNDLGSDIQQANEAENGGGEAQQPIYEDHRTAAEKRYDEQREQLDVRRLAKLASKSHRHRIEEFNQYLANLSEHYDIPKVGPG